MLPVFASYTLLVSGVGSFIFAGYSYIETKTLQTAYPCIVIGISLVFLAIVLWIFSNIWISILKSKKNPTQKAKEIEYTMQPFFVIVKKMSKLLKIIKFAR